MNDSLPNLNESPTRKRIAAIHESLIQRKKVQRVAAAFGVGDLRMERSYRYPGIVWRFKGTVEDNFVYWEMGAIDRCVFHYQVSRGSERCYVFFDYNRWWCSPHHDLSGPLARAFYCLGFEDEGVFKELNYPLSAHERLELRLNFPREFWPAKWLDEAEGTPL